MEVEQVSKPRGVFYITCNYTGEISRAIFGTIVARGFNQFVEE